MKRPYTEEKGEMLINGHKMSWNMIRSEKPSVFGIQESRIYELNIFRDGTLTADYNRKWLKPPYIEDDETPICINYLVQRFGQENKKKKKGEK